MLTGSLQETLWFLSKQIFPPSQEFKNKHLLWGHWDQHPRGWWTTCYSRSTGCGSLTRECSVWYVYMQCLDNLLCYPYSMKYVAVILRYMYSRNCIVWHSAACSDWVLYCFFVEHECYTLLEVYIIHTVCSLSILKVMEIYVRTSSFNIIFHSTLPN